MVLNIEYCEMKCTVDSFHKKEYYKKYRKAKSHKIKDTAGRPNFIFLVAGTILAKVQDICENLKLCCAWQILNKTYAYHFSVFHNFENLKRYQSLNCQCGYQLHEIED